MAEEGKPTSSNEHGITEGIFAVIVIILLFNVLLKVPDFLRDQFGYDLPLSGFGINETTELGDNTPLGTEVLQTNKGTLYSAPGGTPLGTISRGATGSIIGGPVLRNGKLWWYVLYDDGTEGWMSSDGLAVDRVRDAKTLKSDTPRGTPVENTSETTLHSSPGGFVIDTKDVGKSGVIIDGPAIVDDKRWWRIRYQDGTQGWVHEENLEINVAKDRLAIKETTLLETRIRNKDEVTVFNRPRGSIVGSQKKGAIGFITGGPAVVNLDRWWNIDYEEEVNGWVEEQYLEHQTALAGTANSVRKTFLTISISISVIFLIVIGYLTVRLWQLNSVEREKFGLQQGTLSGLPSSDRDYMRNERWEKVEQYAESDDETNWRLAILEADIMLDDMVKRLGHQGETLGERMKAIERSDFLTLDKAWEAHNIRNKIAHEGSDYIVTKRETRRVINLFKDVFNEFHII